MREIIGFNIIADVITFLILLLDFDLTLKEKLIFWFVSVLCLAILSFGVYLLVGVK